MSIRTYHKPLLAFGIALVVAFAIGIFAVLLQMRNDAINDNIRDAENIAMLLGEQTTESVQSFELVLDEVATEIRRRDPSSLKEGELCPAGGGILAYSAERIAHIPSASSIVIIGPDGDVICTTTGWPTKPTNLGDRDYFQRAASSRSGDLFIGKPVISKLSGAWTLGFSKRLETVDGHFLGVALLGVRIDVFSRIFDTIRSIPNEVISLVLEDGTLILRYPDPTTQPGQQIPRNVPWYDMVKIGGGSYHSPGIFDHRPRWVAVRPIARYPLVVDVSISEADVLAEWKTRALVIVAMSVVIEAALVLLLSLLFRQLRRLQDSEARLNRKSSEASLANARFDAALSNMSQGLAMFDAKGAIVIHNRKYQEIWNFEEEELFAGATVDKLIEIRSRRGLCPPKTLEILANQAERSKKASSSDVLELNDGRRIRVITDTMPDGGWVATHEDITESQRAHDRIAYMAFHDELTGLANRPGFISGLAEQIGRAADGYFAILLIDLDRFKEVNDTFGHWVGDKLLCAFAERLQAILSEGDIAARLGGDEFAIYCRLEAADGQASRDLASRVINDVKTPFKIDSNEISISLSIGIEIASLGDFDLLRILRHADLALYRAKSEGRNRCRVFESTMEEDFQTRLALTADLKAAIEADELTIFYQPIVDTASLKIRTMEALARWRHPVKGMISPAVFIPLAEEAGLINELGEWVLRRACLDALAWPCHVRLAVNVSAIQISHPDFDKTVARVLEETRLSPSRLELEITESTLVSDAAHALSTLEAIKRLNVSVALDDFGTGYSSLSYLKTFPFDAIKIDKSFIDDIQTHRGCATIVAAIRSLASGFDMLVTAEGVETREQYELLRAAAVDQIQGYLFGKPAPAEAWDFIRPLIAA